VRCDSLLNAAGPRDHYPALLAAVVVCTGAVVLTGAVVGGATGGVGFGAGAAELRAGAGVEAGAAAADDAAPDDPVRGGPAAPEEAGAALESVPESALALEPAAVPEEPWLVDAALPPAAGAERTKSVAKATAASALSCVVRQVSLDRRRSPSPRPPSESSDRILHSRVQVSVSQAPYWFRAHGQHIALFAKTRLRSC
jgi:hypothetical protein